MELQERFGFLGGAYSEYVEYFHDPDARPLWRFRFGDDVKAVAGFSVVPKTDGRQRKLLMAVAANYMWVEAAARSNMGMHAGASLASGVVMHDTWHLAASDESNAFTVVVVPEWMQLWFSALPPCGPETSAPFSPRS